MSASGLLIGAAALGAGVLLAIVLARLAENSLIFFPARYPAGDWDAAGAGAGDVFFATEDGLTLHGWRFDPALDPATATAATASGAGPAAVAAGSPTTGEAPAAGDFPVVLFAHGNAGNLTGRAGHARALAERGISVFVFDYRGYGRSEGSPSEAGIYRDADAAYRLLTEDWAIAPRRIVLMGRSLGSAPAARLATRVPHAGLVLISPLPSAARMARLMFGGLPADLLIRSRLPVVDWVGQRRQPLLVVHGGRDEVIPLRYGQEVFEAAAEPKRFLLLPAAGHNDVLAAGGSLYLDTVAGFVDEVVSGR